MKYDNFDLIPEADKNKATLMCDGAYVVVEQYVEQVDTISMSQCRQQLILIGKDDDVEPMIASIQDPIQQKLVRTQWEYETVVKKSNALIQQFGSQLGIDIDSFFIEASKL